MTAAYESGPVTLSRSPGASPNPREVTRADSRPSQRGDRLFLMILLGSQIYYFHRYVFRYSDPGTSPTYAPTPFIWQFGKYALLGLATAILFANVTSRRKPRIQHRGLNSFLFTMTIVCAVFTLVEVMLVGPSVGSTLIELWWFWPTLLLLPHIYRDAIPLERVLNVIGILALYNILFSAWQLFNYHHSGRLPALAYPHGLIRFGGGLDDPNGFGIWVILPLLLLAAGWPRYMTRRARLILAIVLLYLLVRTVSYSAGIAFLMGFLLFVVITRQFNRAVAGLVVLIGGLSYEISSGAVSRAIGYKVASAGSRFDFSATTGLSSTGKPAYTVSGYLNHLDLTRFLFGGAATAPHTEIGYLAVAMSFGFPAMLLLLGVICITVGYGIRRTRSFRNAGRELEAKLVGALTAYCFAFAVGSLGVPYFTVFPANLFFWLVATLIWMPIELSEEPGRRRTFRSQITRRRGVVPRVGIEFPGVGVPESRTARRHLARIRPVVDQ